MLHAGLTPERYRLWLQAKIWEAAGYTPFEEHNQFHNARARFKLVAGGVGAGKSWSTAMELAKYVGIANGVIWIIGPSYDLATPEFTYLLDVLDDLGAVDKKSVSTPQHGQRRFKLLEEYGGCEVLTKTSENNERLAGVRPHAIAVTEAAQHPSTIVEKAVERGTQHNAPVILSGTFEGSFGWYAQLWERWQGPNSLGAQSFSIPTWANRFHYPGGRHDPKILAAEEVMSPELFMERYGGVPCKPSGLVFKEFSSKVHLRPFEELYDPDLPVEIWVDPGVHTYAVLFAQVQADVKTVHILDEVYQKNVIGHQIIPHVVARPLWDKVTRGIIDVYGARREGANRPQVEVWNEVLHSLSKPTIPWTWKVIQDVNIWYNQIHLRLWYTLNQEGKIERKPLLFFSDKLNPRIEDDGTVHGIVGEMFTHSWPKYNEFQAIPSRPLKRNMDALSACGYGLVGHFGPVEVRNTSYKSVLTPYF